MIDRTKDIHWEDAIRAALRVRAADPVFAGRLRRDLLRKAAAGHPVRPLPALRPAWTAAGIILALLSGTLLLIGPEKVAAALQSLFGYVPGAGFVRMDQPFRVLARPVSAEQSGASLYILQVLADEGRTVVVYEVDCPGPETQWLKTGTYCTDAPTLELPDGILLKAAERLGRSDLPYYRERAEFPAVPSDADSVIFRIPLRAAPGEPAAPWRVELPLKGTGGEATVYPVLEITPATEPVPGAASDPLPLGLAVSLERIVAMPGQYLLQGILEWDPGRYTSAEAEYRTMEIMDGDGNLCPVEFAAPDPAAAAGENRSAWAVRFNPQGRPGPFLLRVRSIKAGRIANAPFEMDFGPARDIGRIYWLDIPLRAAEYDLRVLSARIGGKTGAVSVVFSFRGAGEVIGADWHDAAQTILPGDGGGTDHPGIFESAGVYRTPPAGRHTIVVETLLLRFQGSWVILFGVNY
jgi:hypothetical protein